MDMIVTGLPTKFLYDAQCRDVYLKFYTTHVYLSLMIQSKYPDIRSHDTSYDVMHMTMCINHSVHQYGSLIPRYL